MANNIAFQPMGKTTKVTATTVASVTQIAADSPVNQYRVTNGAADRIVFVRIASTSSNAAEPNASPEYGLSIMPSQSVIISGPSSGPQGNSYFSVVSNANSAVVYVTPGEGL